MSIERAQSKAAGGYTLVEMMVVIVLMAILVAWALPSYKKLIADSRMSQEINGVATDLELARSAAIKQGLPVTVCASPAPTESPPSCGNDNNWNTGWITFIDVAGDKQFDAGTDTLLKVHNPLEGTDTLGAQSYITFNRMGGASTANPASATSTAIFTLNDSASDASLRRCLVVSQAGTSVLDSEQTQSQGKCL